MLRHPLYRGGKKARSLRAKQSAAARVVAFVGSIALFGTIGIVTGVWRQTVDVLRPVAGGSPRRSLLTVDGEGAAHEVGPGGFLPAKRRKKNQGFYSVVVQGGEGEGEGDDDDDASDEHPECADTSNITFLNITDGNDTYLANWSTTECDKFKDRGDKCLFVTCADKCQPDGGFINYLLFPYCKSKAWVGLVLYGVWILFLFIALGTAAEEFFCPALSVISDVLGLSQNVAGVTFLAFGNGAPDIFSVYASINAGDSIKGTALALGELYGAGMFVTTVVVGVVSIAVPFKLTRRPFIRDVMAYLTAAVWSYIALWDGYISIGESAGFIGVYVLYVLVVIVGRYIYQKNKKRKSTSSLAIKHRMSKTEEMLPAPPRPEMQDHSLSSALHAVEGMAVADAIALGPDLGSETFTAAVQDARKAAMPPGPIYEDEDAIDDAAGDDEPLLNPDADEDDPLFSNNSTASPNPLFDHTDMLAETLGDGTPMVDRRTMLEAQKDPWMELLEALNPIDVEEFRETAFVWKIYAILAAPITFLMTITIPVVDLEEDDQNWKQYLSAVQCVTAPLFTVAGAGFAGKMIHNVFPIWLVATMLGMVLAGAVLGATSYMRPPKAHSAAAFVGFIVSVVWIYSVANEIVNVLQVIGRILSIKDAILGITVLAWGNSIGDFVSNLTVAKQGFPQMAIGACFGGPALNLLLGVGVSCLVACITKVNPATGVKGDWHKPDADGYPIDQVTNLKVSGAFLILSLLSSLIAIPLSKFKSSKIFGYYLVALYVTFVGVCLYVEIAHVGESGGN